MALSSKHHSHEANCINLFKSEEGFKNFKSASLSLLPNFYTNEISSHLSEYDLKDERRLAGQKSLGVKTINLRNFGTMDISIPEESCRLIPEYINNQPDLD